MRTARQGDLPDEYLAYPHLLPASFVGGDSYSAGHRREEWMTYEGVLIMESLAVGAIIDVPMACRKISRIRPSGTTENQSPIWTLADFEIADEGAESFAQALAGALDQPGWYADFRSDTETWVVFPDRTFTYARGDAAARGAAMEHGRQLKIPKPQLDWPI